jgi:aminoglycoside phosphotransferase (APT) family kinase protein
VSDPRVHPLIELDRATVEAMLAPILHRADIRLIEPVEGGLTNTVCRVTAGDGTGVALRVYASGRSGFELERRLLPRLADVLPVPEVLFVGAGGAWGHPYLVYRWIEGITLNECRRQTAPTELGMLAEPLGRLLARVAAQPPAADPLRDPSDPARLERVRIAMRIEQADEQLRAGLARERTGGEPADRLRARLESRANELIALDRLTGLVHGDFGGRNLLVRATDGGAWQVAGVLDWESATLGSALWDVGHFFRYPRRYSPEFRAEFARGYRAAGGALPGDWWRLARLLDATRLVATLNEPRELPGVFAECRELVASIVREWDCAPGCRA